MAEEWEDWEYTYDYDSEGSDSESDDDEGESDEGSSDEGDLPQYFEDTGDQEYWEPEQYVAAEQTAEDQYQEDYENLWAYQGSTSDTGMGYAPDEPSAPVEDRYGGYVTSWDAESLARPIAATPRPPRSAYDGYVTSWDADSAQDQRVFTQPQPQEAAQAAATGVAPPPAQEPLGEIVGGDPTKFFETAGPYARQVERETGIPAALSLAIAANETGYGQQRYMAGANNYHGIQALPGEAGGAAYQDWRPGPNGEKIYYDAAQRAFDSPLSGFRGFAQFLTENSRYQPALDRYRQDGDVNALAAGIHRAGYAEDPAYTTKITSIMKGIPVQTGVGDVTNTRGGGALAAAAAPRPGAVQAEQTPAAQAQAPVSLSGITPPQFGLGDADADAICGPVLAMAFAKANGRNPTIAEAKQMAIRHGGWTGAQGMGGPEAMANTLRAMDIPAHYAPGPLDVETIRRETRNGNPVGINTRGHYFVVEGVDAEGRLDLGNSAKALRASGGRQWFYPGEIEGLKMGAPTGAIYKDSPASPVPSVAVKETGMPPAAPITATPPAAPRPWGVFSAPSAPPAAPRAAANAQIPAGHYDGDGDEHGVAKPYVQQQVDKDGNVWQVAFDYNQPYENPYNPDVPRHRGVDLRPPGVENGGMNMPYQAFRDGTVTRILRDEHGGIGVIVDTGDGTARYDRYFHNNAVSVKEGDRVVAGQTNIGLLGQTGSEGFPHLHYEVSQNIDGDPVDKTIDPRPYMSNPGQATPSQRAAAAANPVQPAQAAAPPQVAGATYTLGGQPVTYDQYAKAVVEQQASRQKFIDSLPAPTQQAYTEWEAYRQSRNESTDVPAFREHLDRLGAPNPWREQEESNARITQANAESKAKYEGWLATLPKSTAAVVPQWQAARTAKGEDPNDQAALSAHLDYLGVENPFKPRPAAAAPGQAAAPVQQAVYTVGGREVGEAEYRAAVAENERQRAAKAEFDAGVAREEAALEAYGRELQSWNRESMNPEYGQNAGPQPTRPETPLLNMKLQGGAPEGRGAATATYVRTVNQGLGVNAPAATRPAAMASALEDEAMIRQNQQGMAAGALIARSNEITRQTGVLKPFETVVTGYTPGGYAINQTRPTPELQAQQAEVAVLRDWQERAEAAAVDREAASTLGPRPPTPILDAHQAQQAAALQAERDALQIWERHRDTAAFDPAAAETLPPRPPTPILDTQETLRGRQSAPARAEEARLEDWQRRSEAARVDPEAAATLGPRPPTPNLDAERMQAHLARAAQNPIYGPREPGWLITPTGPAAPPNPSAVLAATQAQARLAAGETPKPFEPSWITRVTSDLAPMFSALPMGVAGRAVPPAIATADLLWQNRDTAWDDIKTAITRDSMDTLYRAQIGAQQQIAGGTEFMGAQLHDAAAGMYAPSDLRRQAQEYLGSAVESFGKKFSQASEDYQLGLQQQGINTVRPPDKPINYYDPRDYLGLAVESTPIMAGAMLAGIAGGAVAGPPGAIAASSAVMYAAEGGDAYKTALDAGVDRRTAMTLGTIVGVANAALENAPIMGVLGKVAGPAAKSQVIRSLTSGLASAPGVRLATHMLTNGFQEGTEEVFQGLVSNAAESTYNAHKDMSEGLLESFVGALIPGMGLSTQSLAGRFRDSGHQLPAEILAAEHVQIQALSVPGLPDWTRYAIREITPDGQQQSTFVVAVAPNGDVRPSHSRYDGGANLPTSSTAADRDASIHGVDSVLAFLGERGVLTGPTIQATSAAFKELADRSLQSVEAGVEQAVRASAAPQNAAQSVGMQIEGDPEAPSRYIPPERFDNAGVVEGTGITFYTPNQLPPEHAEAIRTERAHTALAPVLADLADRLNIRAQDVAVLPQADGSFKFAMTWFGGGATALDDNRVGKRTEGGVSRKRGGITVDLGQVHLNAVTQALADGVDRADPRFPRYLSAAIVKAIAHEGGHEVSEGHDDPHTGAMNTFGRLLATEKAALEPLLAQLQQEGALESLLGTHLRALQVGSLNDWWQQYGTDNLVHVRSADVGGTARPGAAGAEQRAVPAVPAGGGVAGGGPPGSAGAGAAAAAAAGEVPGAATPGVAAAAERYWATADNPDVQRRRMGEDIDDMVANPDLTVTYGNRPGEAGAADRRAAFVQMAQERGTPVHWVRNTELEQATLEQNGPRAQQVEQWELRLGADPAAATAQLVLPGMEGVPSAVAAQQPAGFQTARGSTYVVNPDGTTTRNKAARTDPGHEGDSGLKAPSEATYYLTTDAARALAPPQGVSRIIDNGDGTLSLITQNSDGRWGVAPSQRNVPYEAAPRVGTTPLELWHREQIAGLPAYGTMHFGNEIVSLQGGAPSAMVSDEGPPSLGTNPAIWTPRPQARSSAATSLRQVPRLHTQGVPWQRGTVNFDLGGGGSTLATEYLDTRGVRNIVYDIGHQTPEEQQAALAEVQRQGGTDTVTVANVLNVIAEPEVRQQVIQQARDALKPGGTAYFSVYPRDADGVGKPTLRDSWQENRPLASYLPEIQQVFPGAYQRGGMIVAPSTQAAPSAMQAEEPPPLIITDQRAGRESDVQAMIDRAAQRQRFRQDQEAATLNGQAGRVMAENGGTAEQGPALAEAIQSAIAMFGPTTDNVRSLLRTLGQGDPEAAPLLVKQARGDTGHGRGGLADLILRHLGGEPTGAQGPAPQAPSGYEMRGGQPIYTGAKGGTSGYRFEDGRPVYQGDQAGYQIQDGRPVYGPSAPLSSGAIVPRAFIAPTPRTPDVAAASAPPPFSGPPLITPEEALTQGWVGIPDPRSPITSRGDLHNRLVLTPFISQQELIGILGERPDDLQHVIEFMLTQRQKVVEGRLQPSDVAKAYLMTASSQGQGAIAADKIVAKTGLAIPDHFLTPNARGVRQIRPEDAAAAWIASPNGQRALAALNRGEFDEAAWAEAAAVRSAFSDDRINNLNVLGTRPNRQGRISMRDVPALTADLNRIGDNPRALANAVSKLNGIGPRKAGFIQHLLGFGEAPTMDARIVNTWITGQGDTRGMDDEASAIARAINAHYGADATGLLTLARIISGYNQLRRSGYAPDIPRAVYNAAMHNWLWSKIKGLDRTYAPMYEAQAAEVSEYVPDTAHWRDDFEVNNRQMESWLRDPYEEEDRERGPAELDEDEYGPSAMAAEEPPGLADQLFLERTLARTPKALEQAELVDIPLARLLERSAAAHGGFSDLSDEEIERNLKPLARMSRDWQALRGFDPIPNPTRPQDIRRIIRDGIDAGWATWYRDFPLMMRRQFGDQNAREAVDLFANYSSQLDPLTAWRLMQATMIASREQGGWKNVDLSERKPDLDENNVQKLSATGKPKWLFPGVLRVKGDIVGVLRRTKGGGGGPDALYESAARMYQTGLIERGRPKTSHFNANLLAGVIPWLADYGVTGDVHMQRGMGYRAWKAGKGEEGGGLPVDMQKETAGDDKVWRYIQTMTGHIADELGLPRRDAQAAFWVAQQRATVAGASKGLSDYRKRNPDAAVFTDPEKLARWKALAAEIKSGESNIGQVYDELAGLGIFELSDPLALPSIVGHSEVQNLQQAYDAASLKDVAWPGVTGAGRAGGGRGGGTFTSTGPKLTMRGGIRYLTSTGVDTRTVKGREVREPRVQPLAEQLQIEAPLLTFGGADPNTRHIRDLWDVPNVVSYGGTTEDGVDQVGVALPTMRIAHERLGAIAQAAADALGQPVTTWARPTYGDEPNAQVIVLDRRTNPQLPQQVDALREGLAGVVEQVQYDGRYVRMLLPLASEEAVREAAGQIHDVVQSLGLDVAQVEPWSRNATTYEPAAGRLTGGVRAEDAASLAESPGAVGGSERGRAAAGVRPTDADIGQRIADRLGRGAPAVSPSAMASEEPAELGLARRPRSVTGEVLGPDTSPQGQAWALAREADDLQRLIDSIPADEREAHQERLTDVQNRLSEMLEDVENRLEEAESAVTEADRAWFENPRAYAGLSYAEAVGEPMDERDLLRAERDTYPPYPQDTRPAADRMRYPGEAPSAMAAEEPPDLGGVEWGRASMTREGASEEEVVEDNRQEINQRYSGDMLAIFVKEVVQNSVDASRELPGAHTQVDIFPHGRRVLVIDQGTGMPYTVIQNEFTRFKGTKKGANASGGMGTAKTAILGRAEKVEVRTVARLDDGSYEESIAFGTGDNYLRPSVGLTTAHGPLGWVDAAIASGQMPPDSLTDPSLTAPWDHETDDGDPATGTRLVATIEDGHTWTNPRGYGQGSPIERWLDGFLASNRVQDQTVGFTMSDQPYTGFPLPEREQAGRLMKTIDGPTWQMDIYASDAVVERTGVSIAVQNNGLYQLDIYLQIPSPAVMPTTVQVNLRSKVGAKERGYPWSPDRMNMVAGTKEALEDYVVNELYREVIARESNALEKALQGGVPLAGGPGRLFNVGSVEGELLDGLHELAGRPYMAILNRGMQKLHDRLSKILDGRSWGFYGGATFKESEFGGFGVADKWIGLNVTVSGLQTRYTKPNVLLYDPWAIVRYAVGSASERDMPLVARRATAQGGPARKAPPSKALRVTKALADWDPNADITLKWKVTEGPYAGIEESHIARPRSFDWDIRYYSEGLEKERAKENPSDWNLAWYGGLVRELEKAYAQYLTKLSDHLAARVILYDEDQEMIDPTAPAVKPRSGDTENYYPAVYGNDTGALYNSIVWSEQDLANETDPERRTRLQERLVRERAIYEFNTAVEDRIWAHRFNEGQVPTVEVNGQRVTLSQEGLDDLASQLNAAEGSAEHYRTNPAAAGSGLEQHYQQQAATLRMVLTRLERVTGLAAQDQTGQGRVLLGETAGAQLAVEGAVPSPEVLGQTENYFLGTTQHEFGHNAVRPHSDEAFSRFNTEISLFASDAETRKLVAAMVAELAKTGGLGQMLADLPLYNRIKSAENVFEKIGVETAPRDIGPDAEDTGGPARGDVSGGGLGGRYRGPVRLPAAGPGSGLPSDDDLRAGDLGARNAEVLRELHGLGGGRAGAYQQAMVARSPTLQAVAAESAANLRDALERAYLTTDPNFGPAADEADRRVIDGFARFYTEAVIGLASNDQARLDRVGLTPDEAAVERERALDVLASANEAQALYEAEAAWATLSGPDSVPPSAMAAEEPPPLSREELEATGQVLQHGTARPFTQFDPSARTNKQTTSGGFFFTEDPSVAHRFAYEGARGTENISIGTLQEAADRGRSLGDLEDLIDADEGLDLEGLRAVARRRLDQGRPVYRISGETGDLEPLTDPQTLTYDDLETGVTTYPMGYAPRTITATVYGETLDLRYAGRWPEDLVETLRTSRDRWDQRLYDAWRDARDYPGRRDDLDGDLVYLPLANSPGLKAYAAERGIGKIRTKDAYESGHESWFVPDVRYIGYGQDPYDLIYGDGTAAPSAMLAEEPPNLAPMAGQAPALADPFYSRLGQVAAAALPDEVEGREEVREPGKSYEEKLVMPAARVRPGMAPKEGSGVLVAPNGDWYRPSRTLPDEIVVAAATPAQRAMELLREGGAKEDEIAWTGIEPWLLARGDAPVTAQEILAYLAQRPVVIEETVYGGTGEVPEIRVRYPSERNWEVIEPEPELLEEGYEDEDGGWVEAEYWTPDDDEWDRRFTMRAVSDTGDELEYEVQGSHANGWTVTPERGEPLPSVDEDDVIHQSLQEVERAVREDAETKLVADLPPDVEGPSRYGPAEYPDLTLPGPGQETHRELLLRLPTPPGTRPLIQVRNEMDDANQALISFMGGRPTSEFLPTIINDPERLKQYAELSMAAGALREEYTTITQGPTGQVYTRGHWDAPNVVLHVRFTERTDAQGRRILMIEELQSDWQQTGRKEGFIPAQGLPKGYRFETKTPGWLDPSLPIDTGDELDPETGEYVNPRRIEPGTPEYDAYIKQYSDLYVIGPRGAEGPFADEAEALKLIRQRLPRAVPDMPFSRTQALIALGLRRMIRYAAENGYSQIGWTRGEVHDIRYPDPTRPPDAFQKFYDQMVVEIANDLGETWGVQVGSTEIDTGGKQEGYFLLLPDGRYTIRDFNTEEITQVDTRAEAEAYLDRYRHELSSGGERVHVMEIPAHMRRSALEQGLPLFMAAEEPPDLSGAMPLWDARDEVEPIDPELLTALDEEAARFEIENPDSPGRTDSPAQVAAMEGVDLTAVAPTVQLSLGLEDDEPIPGPAVPPEAEPEAPSVAPPEPTAATPPPPPPPPPPTAVPPLVTPPEDGEPNLDQFPEWAGKMLLLGENTNRDKPPVSPEFAAEIRGWVENGPNAAALNEAERDALAHAIMLQFNRVQYAASKRGPTGEMTPWWTARMVDEARRYGALRALALVPMDQWGPLAEVWASGPVSQGQGGTLEEFIEQRKAAEDSGDTAAQAALQAEALDRLAAMLNETERRVVGRRTRNVLQQGDRAARASDDANRARRYGQAMAEGVASPFATPGSVADLASDADLKIHPWEVLQNLRYNAMLIGSRGIGIDYLTNTAMLFGKMLADPFLPSTGRLDLRARGAISKAEYAALARAVPLMLRRMGEVMFTGVSYAESDVAGTPRTISGKLTRRIQDRQAMLGLQGRRRVGGRRIGLDIPINPQTGRARANLDPALNIMRLEKATAIGFLELASRLKTMADVGIKTLAYGVEMTRQAAILAWKEGQHPVGSDEWHARVAEILQGNLNPKARTKEEKQAATAQYQHMQNNAQREAERTAFQGDMGSIGRMMEPIQKHPLGQYVLPFLRTLYHIRGWAIDLSPVGLAVTTGDVMRSGIHRKMMQSEGGQRFLGRTRNVGGLLGGPYAQAWTGSEVGKGVSDLDRRLMANMVGTTAFFYLVGLAFEGLLSGTGPPDEPVVFLDDGPNFDKVDLRRAMEADRWQRYSIKVNGRWYSYQQWGPLAYLMASAAAIGEAYRYGVPASRRRAAPSSPWYRPDLKMAAGARGMADVVLHGDQETFKNAGRRFFSVAADMSYLGGMIDLVQLMERSYKAFGPSDGPELETDRTKRQRKGWVQLGGYGVNILTSYVPMGQALNQAAQSQDPYLRATEFGTIGEALAHRIPDLGPVAAAALPYGLPWLLGSDLGSESGRRSGLPILRDAMGREAPNQYAGIWGWLPVRASGLSMNDATLNTLIEGGVGPPSPPTEVLYFPEGSKTGYYLLVPQSSRQEMAAWIGKEANDRVAKLAAATPEAERRADPEKWSKTLADEISGLWLEASKAWVEDPKNKPMLNRLARDPSRSRTFVSNADRDKIFGGELADPDKPAAPSAPRGTAVPGTTPRPTGTPRPSAPSTPRPSAPSTPTPQGPSQADIDRGKARGQTPQPSTPRPATPPPVTTPPPAAPPSGGKTQAEIDRERARQRAPVGVP